MLYLVLLPLLPALWFVATRSLADALIDVYLPVLLFVPGYYAIEIPHFMAVSAEDAALLPIAIGVLIKYGKQWRLHRADIWMMVFLLGSGYPEGVLKFSQGLRTFAENLFAIGVPYIVGRLLLEHEGVRVRFVRRFLWLLAIVAALSVVEFRLGRDLFTAFWKPIFGFGSPNIEQVRGGFERAQGPFGHAIAAGMIFGSAWVLALWLRYRNKLVLGPTEPRFLGVRRSTMLVGIQFMGLVISYSRGPWLGAALSYSISLIGRAKNAARTAVIVGMLGVVVGGGMYKYLDAYTSAAVPKDQDQENAIYRRLLLEAYQPVVDASGFFGWGPRFPREPGMPSLDNYYLLLHVTQGSVGLWVFLLLFAEALASLAIFARRSVQGTEFAFAITMLSVLAGLLLIFASNGPGYQAENLVFLYLGWSLSVGQARPASVTQPEHVSPALQTRKIFT